MRCGCSIMHFPDTISCKQILAQFFLVYSHTFWFSLSQYGFNSLHESFFKKIVSIIFNNWFWNNHICSNAAIPQVFSGVLPQIQCCTCGIDSLHIEFFFFLPPRKCGFLACSSGNGSEKIPIHICYIFIRKCLIQGQRTKLNKTNSRTNPSKINFKNTENI